MKIKVYIHFLIIAVLSLMPGLVSLSIAGGGGGSLMTPANLGFIYGIEGKVDLKPMQSDPVRLQKEKDILRIVRDGDKIKTTEDGKLVMVLLSDKMGYELAPNTLVQFVGRNLTTIRGTVNKIEGLYFPETISPLADKFGILVADMPLADSCLKPLSPRSTAIITTTPTLTWENNCAESERQVTVKVIVNKRIVYEAITGDSYMKIPKDVLNFEQSCTWLIDGGKNGLVGGVFSILSEEDIKDALEKKYRYTQHEGDMHERLSYIFYLKFKGLNEMANSETVIIKEELPDNPLIRLK